MMLNPFVFQPLGVFAALACHMVVGFLWYSPALFGTIWMRGLKFDEKNLSMHAGHIIGTALVGLCIALTLGHFLSLAGVTSCTTAIEYALTYWLGFVAAPNFSQVIWAQKPIPVWMVDIGFYAVDFSLIACIMVKMG